MTLAPQEPSVDTDGAQTAVPLTGPPTGFALGGLRQRLEGLFRGTGPQGTLARGTVWSFGTSVLGMVVSFGLQILLARTMGVADYGTYLYALGWMNVVLVLAKLDFDNAAVRFVGAYNGRGDWPLLRGFLHRSHQIVAVVSLSVATAGAAGLWAFRAHFESTAQLTTYLIACVLLPVSAILQLRTLALQGFKRVLAAQVPALLLRPVLLVAAVAVTHFVLGRRVSAPVAVGLNCLTLVVVVLVSGRLLQRAMPAPARGVPREYAMGEWWSVVGSMLVISTSQIVLSQQSDVVLVGLLVGTTGAALYGTCSQLASLVVFGNSAVMVITAPMIAEMYAQNRRDALRRMVRVAAAVNVLASVPVFLGVALVGRPLLGLYGPSFPAAYPVLLVLAASQCVVGSVGSLAGFVMIMTEHQRMAARIIAGSAVLNVVLTVVLTPRYGIIGTAIATLVAVLVRTTTLSTYIWKALRINPLPTLRLT